MEKLNRRTSVDQLRIELEEERAPKRRTSLNFLSSDPLSNIFGSAPIELKVNVTKFEVSSNLTSKCFNEPDLDQNIKFERNLFEKDKEKEKEKEYFELLGATPVKLIEKMTIDGFLDPDFLEDLLQSFRSFLSPHDFLHLLLLRLKWTQEDDNPNVTEQELKSIQKKTLQVLLFWVDMHHIDFKSNVGMTSKMRFHFDLLSPLGMRSHENDIIFNSILSKFGLPKRVAQQQKRLSGSISFTDYDVLAAMKQKGQGPDKEGIFNEAKVEKEKEKRSRMRPRSATNRWVPMIRRDSDGIPTPTFGSFRRPFSTTKSVLNDNPAKPRSSLDVEAPERSGLESESLQQLTPESSTSQTLIDEPPTISALLLLKADSDSSSSHPPSPVVDDKEKEKEKEKDKEKDKEEKDPEKDKEKPRRPSRSLSVSQKMSRLSDQTRRLSKNLILKTKEISLDFVSFILNHRSKNLVQQLCLIEQRMYKALTRTDLCELGWTKKKRDDNDAKHVLNIINRFNDMSRFIAYEILRAPSAETRARIIEKCIRIQEKCLAEKNFATLMQIDIALQRQEVYNLKKSWHNVGTYEKDLLKKIREVTSPVRNFKGMRDQLEGISGFPAVPFLGLYLSDLVFNAELPYTCQDVRLIHIKKFRNQGNIIRRALKFTYQPNYPFEEDQLLLHRLILLPFCSEATINKLSKGVD